MLTLITLIPLKIFCTQHRLPKKKIEQCKFEQVSTDYVNIPEYILDTNKDVELC